MILGWLNNFITEFYYLVAEMAPYLLLGFLFAGVLKAFFPTDQITRFMGRNRLSSVINASLLGVPMPLCSCGVIPTGVSFYNNGATKGATTSFLISTPQTGVDSILATYSLLGLPMAVIRPIVAFFTGLLGGSVSHAIQKDQWHPDKADGRKAGRQEVGDKVKGKRFKTIISYGFGELVEDILKWLVIGLLAAAVLSVLIPDSFFTRYIGSPWLEMLMILAASIPLYVCATGSIPIAAVFMLKGLSPGAALVFLMAGPATNVATMTVIAKTMGKKALAIYLFSIIGGAVAFGTIVNELLPAEWFTGFTVMDHEHGFLPEWVKLASAIILALVSLLAAYNKWISPKFIRIKKSGLNNNINSNMGITTIKVEGMTCNHCKAAVESNIESIEGVEKAEVDLSDGYLRIEGKISLDKVENVVNDLGYKYNGIV